MELSPVSSGFPSHPANPSREFLHILSFQQQVDTVPASPTVSRTNDKDNSPKRFPATQLGSR